MQQVALVKFTKIEFNKTEPSNIFARMILVEGCRISQEKLAMRTRILFAMSRLDRCDHLKTVDCAGKVLCECFVPANVLYPPGSKRGQVDRRLVVVDEWEEIK